MNKNYIKLCMVLITVLLSFYTFLSTRYEYSTMSSVSVLLSFLFALPIIMHSKYNRIKYKKYRIIYLIIMSVLYFISIFIVLFLLLEIILNKTDIFIKFDTFKIMFSNLLFMTTSWLILLFSFIDIEKEETKTNFISNMIVLFVIVLVHINYYINPNLKTLINETMIGEKALYITQNYVYFGIMYVLIIANKLISK